MREAFNKEDKRPLQGKWFEKKTVKFAGSRPETDKELVVFCQTFDKGVNISEVIATEEVIAKHPVEYAAFKATQKVDIPIEADVSIEGEKSKGKK